MDSFASNIRLISLIILTTFHVVAGVTKVSFKFNHFLNEYHTKIDGTTCDEWWWYLSPCDNKFNICFGPIPNPIPTVPPPLTVESCPFGLYSTGKIYSDDDDFDFPADMNGVANPVILTFDQWLGGFGSYIQVIDVDTWPRKDDIIDEIGHIFGGQEYFPAPTEALAQPINTTLDEVPGFATISVTVKVYCDTDYYGFGCTTYCVGRDDDLGHYYCDPLTGIVVCIPGWEGTDCTEATDECEINICLNDGVCLDLHAAYQCICPEGTLGFHCETDIDECASDPCIHGTCTTPEAYNTYTCTCIPGYTGINCEENIDECASNPCHNGGTCLDLENAYFCVCPEHKLGDHCMIDIDDCTSNPCVNGVCTIPEGRDTYTCTCIGGFTGINCEDDIDECDSNPCQNGGSCLNLEDAFFCICPSGKTGEVCNFEVNECEDQECFNGGVCVDVFNGFACQCPDGFSGEQCEVDSSADQLGLSDEDNGVVIERWILIVLAVVAVVCALGTLTVMCMKCRKKRFKDALYPEDVQMPQKNKHFLHDIYYGPPSRARSLASLGSRDRTGDEEDDDDSFESSERQHVAQNWMLAQSLDDHAQWRPHFVN